MHFAALGVGSLTAFLALGGLHTPIMWSPDGRWVAYTMVARPREEVLKPGWLFGVGTDLERAVFGGADQNERRLSGLTYRLWATRADNSESVLLEESQGPLTSPGWSPDGSALAFSRLVSDASGGGRFEIVVQNAPSRQRVIHSQSVARFEPEAAGLPGLAVCWSSDGRHLAVPMLQPRGLAFLRADNGRQLEKVENAYFPAWSPDGSKIAFFMAGEAGGVFGVDTNFGPPRCYLADPGQAFQPPVWSRDGRSVLVVRRKAVKGKSGQIAAQSELVRVRVDRGRVEKLFPPSDDPTGREGEVRGVSFAVDSDGEELFYAANVQGEPSSITWYRFRERETFKLFNPFDVSVPMGALAASLNGKRLALRVGLPDMASPPAFCDLESDKLTPLVPDDSARLEWLSTIIATARRIILLQFPAPAADGQSVQRATLLPEPGEIAGQQEAFLHLRRLARIGRRLCDRPADALPADSDLEAILEEARLFFDYLRHDYSAALAALDVLEQRVTQPERRVRLMGLRAQIYLGQGDVERAAAATAYLQSVESRQVRQFEMTPAGPSLSGSSAPGKGWPDFLAKRAEALRQGLSPNGTGEPGFSANPDAPQPGLGLDPANQVDPNPNRDEPVIPFRVEQIELEDLIRALPRRDMAPFGRDVFERKLPPTPHLQPRPPADRPAPKL